MSGFKRKRPYEISGRGGPGILLTCETGRENKCRREGLEILQHYWDQSRPADDTSGKADTAALSLDDELAQLKSRKAAGEKKVFHMHDTGCKGTVLAMFRLAGDDSQKRARDENSKDDEPQLATKESKEDTEDTTSAAPADDDDEAGEEPPAETLPDAPWDPISTVQTVMKDLKAGSTSMPSSRFVSRMIPFQVTCYASLDEIQRVVRRLLTGLPKSESSTFAVRVKRRICGHLTRDDIIDAVATLVVEEKSWKVDLKQPSFTLWVEVCRTTCGISIFPSETEGLSENFNLAQLRASEEGDPSKAAPPEE